MDRNKTSNTKTTKMPKSWIVKFWSKVFKLLSYISIFSVIRRIAPSFTKTYTFVEYYVTLNTALSVIALFIVTYRKNFVNTLFLSLIMGYGFVRTFEIIIYQINVLLFDEYRTSIKGRRYAVRGYRRMVLLLFHNYIEIVCWFGVAYMWFYKRGYIVLKEAGHPTFLNVFHESMILMFSFSPSQYIDRSNLGLALFTTQAIIGLFMTMVVFARFLGLLPPPRSMDELENHSDEKH